MVGIATAAVLAGGTAGAVAATDDGRAAEQQVLTDAGKRLGVSAEDLRAALRAAEDAQLDAAVKAGELTREQADRIREHRRADGSVLRLAPGFGRSHHGRPVGHPGGGRLMDDVADALGISHAELFERLRSGKTLAAIAKAEGKSLPEVKAAVRRAATEHLDADLKAGRITRAQHADLVEHLGDHLDHLGERPVFRRWDGPGETP
jgi:hypothetical protein